MHRQHAVEKCQEKIKSIFINSKHGVLGIRFQSFVAIPPHPFVGIDLRPVSKTYPAALLLPGESLTSGLEQRQLLPRPWSVSTTHHSKTIEIDDAHYPDTVHLDNHIWVNCALQSVQELKQKELQVFHKLESSV
ncbi:hypothetical protein NC652_030758 [Populus alba x Populus x berolinensis]|nr:hypothetical protein NC652_030758 [Populus alba x Populus x berolinensis]